MPIPSRPANNFLVAKWSDIYGSLNAQEIDALVRMLVKLAQYRRSDSRADNRQYVVVSDKNRSMFDEVWGMVLSEIERSTPRPIAMDRSNPYSDGVVLGSSSGLTGTLRSRLQQFEEMQRREQPRTRQVVARGSGASLGSTSSASTTMDELEISYQSAWAGRTPILDPIEEEESYALNSHDFNGTESVDIRMEDNPQDFSVDQPSTTGTPNWEMRHNRMSFQWQPGVRDSSEEDSREAPSFIVGDLETTSN